MHFRRHATRAALLTAALFVIAPSSAQAQLGGLRRKMEKQIEKAVLGESEQSKAAPVFNDRVLEINDARLSQLIAGLRVEAEQAEREKREQAAENARAAEQQAKSEAYAKCAKPFSDELLKNTGIMMGLALAAKREENSKGSVSPALRDSVQAVTIRMQRTAEALKAKCGEEPKDPSFDMNSGGEDPQELGAKAAKLTGDQYSVLRERVAAYLRSKGDNAGPYVFTAGERAALSARAGDLAAYKKLLTS